MRVLVECEEDASAERNLLARTDDNRPVRVRGGTDLIGRFADVRITKCVKWSMEAELLPEKEGEHPLGCNYKIPLMGDNRYAEILTDDDAVSQDQGAE